MPSPRLETSIRWPRRETSIHWPRRETSILLPRKRTTTRWPPKSAPRSRRTTWPRARVGHVPLGVRAALLGPCTTLPAAASCRQGIPLERDPLRRDRCMPSPLVRLPTRAAIAHMPTRLYSSHAQPTARMVPVHPYAHAVGFGGDFPLEPSYETVPGEAVDSPYAFIDPIAVDVPGSGMPGVTRKPVLTLDFTVDVPLAVTAGKRESVYDNVGRAGLLLDAEDNDA
jgi:hypothetical protein